MASYIVAILSHKASDILVNIGPDNMACHLLGTKPLAGPTIIYQVYW